MDTGDILFNQDRIVLELTSLGRSGMDSLVQVLRESDFFESRVDNSDPGEGSLANYCLWVMRIGLDTYEYAISRRKSVPVERESVILVSLLHRVFSARTKQIPSSVQDSKERMQVLLKKTGIELLDIERQILLDGPVQNSSIDSKDALGLLSYILSGSIKNAQDYASGIPYSQKPLEKILPRPMNVCSEVYMDEEDHRLWWNVTLPGFEAHDNPELKDFTKVPTTSILPLTIGDGSTEPECAVLTDESGVMGFLAGFTREEDGTVFMRSDRLCFGYSDMVFFLSRYPHYRPSYVLAQRTDGKWGAFSIKASGKKRPPIVDVVPLVRHESRNKEAAIRSIKTKAGYPARVKHHLFYNEISVLDAFLQE